MRIQIHLTEEEMKGLTSLIDQAEKIAGMKNQKTSDVFKEYCEGKKGDEPYILRFHSENQ